MSADGTEAFPAVSKIVRLTSLGEKTVRRALEELRRGKWLKVTEELLERPRLRVGNYLNADTRIVKPKPNRLSRRCVDPES